MNLARQIRLAMPKEMGYKKKYNGFDKRAYRNSKINEEVQTFLDKGNTVRQIEDIECVPDSLVLYYCDINLYDYKDYLKNLGFKFYSNVWHAPDKETWLLAHAYFEGLSDRLHSRSIHNNTTEMRTKRAGAQPKQE